MTPEILLYRRSLALKSGAARLIEMQAAGLENAGVRVRIAGARGRWKFLLGTRRYVSRMDAASVSALAASASCFVVDHDLSVPEAGVAFVHNLQTALNGYLPGHVPRDVLDAEAGYFERLSAEALIVANSALVRDALESLLGVAPPRIVVHHPGFDAVRFSTEARQRLRKGSRAALGVDTDTPLVGLVTSGHFAKRGIGTFLDAAERIHVSRPDARFLVVGSTTLPAGALSHPLVRSGVVIHRRKSARPETSFAALDVMLYPAVFEEFGLVVAEAQAMGVPVVVSARVGAAETLPEAYRAFGLADPDPGAFALKCLALLEDSALAERLAEAGARSIGAWAGPHYAAATAATILAQKRRLR